MTRTRHFFRHIFHSQKRLARQSRKDMAQPPVTPAGSSLGLEDENSISKAGISSDPGDGEASDRVDASHSEDGDHSNGLYAHRQISLTAEERKAEKRFLLKIDFIILPLIASIYFLAALDRSDVGNAAVAGMTTDLKLSAAELSFCVAFFYIGFLAFQLPGSIMVRLLTPPIQLGAALVIWGGATAIMTEANNWQTIAGLRIVVGCFEAFIQGAPLYLTFWYKPHELATRGAIFMSMTSLAGSMNGLIAYSIQTTMEGVHGRRAWRWIFLIEGVASVGFGVLIFFILPNTPEKVKRWFTEDEKKIALRRTKEAYNIPNTKISLGQLKATVRDPKTWFYCVINLAAAISQAAWGQFLPVLLNLNGYTPNEAQIMSIPVYVCAGVSAIACGYLSDRFRIRGIFVIIGLLVAAAGWLILILSKNQQLSYAGTYFVGIGSSPCVIVMLAWMNNNVLGYTKKAGTLAVVNMIGHLGAIGVSFSFNNKPNYYLGKSLAMGSALIATCTTVMFLFYLDRQNARKLANKDTVEARMLRQKTVEEVYDGHPDFMYSK